MTSYLKTPLFRSEQFRKLVTSLPCQVCGQEGTQAAHANLSCFGKGMSKKASDFAIMALCPTCHSELDQGRSMTKEDRKSFQFEMISKTLVAVLERDYLERKNG